LMTDDLGLPDLLELCSTAVAADGALVALGVHDDAPVILASHPGGITGWRLPLSKALMQVCGYGVHPTDGLLLPSSMTGWLGFRPGFVAATEFKLNESAGCLFFWWKTQPTENAGLESHLEMAAKLVGRYAGLQATTNELQGIQERLDVILERVSLGIVFVDFQMGSLVNSLAAKILDVPTSTSDTATVIAAMQRAKAACKVEAADDEESMPDSGVASAEYWISPARNTALRVESHPVGNAQSPGRFWVFTDVKPLWDSRERTKYANRVLERNIGMLAEEMERRMEAEDQLRRYNTGLKQQNQELEIAKLHSDLLANQDALTGLGNRRRFRHGLEEMLAKARDKNSCVAVLYLDLDKFKPVNDSLGHERGDQVLRDVADTLVKVLRKDDLIARLGGDEFACALALPAATTAASLRDVLEDLREHLQFPVESGDVTIVVRATIGVSLYPDDATDAAGLLRAADNAMYLGKNRGGNEVIAFNKGEMVR
jgi:diguanylate cyclase (GGDEF)-like protein